MIMFDENYELIDVMYRDEYFPDFLVDKIKELIQSIITFLETGEKDLEIIQDKFDKMTVAINDLQDEFEDNDSELETVARDSIAETIDYILHWFDLPINVEDAFAERDW